MSSVKKRVGVSALIILTLVAYTVLHGWQSEPVPYDIKADPAAISLDKEDRVALGAMLISQLNYDAAEPILRDITDHEPKGWAPFVERGDTLEGAFWNEGELEAYKNYLEVQGRKGKKIRWIRESIAAAYYYRARIHMERGDLNGALSLIDESLTRESDHPQTLSLKALLLHQQKKFSESYSLYMKASSVRPWAKLTHVAEAFHGAANELIALKRYPEARALLEQSLRIDPSEASKNDLAFVQRLLEQTKGN